MRPNVVRQKPSGVIVDEAEVEAALDWLRDSAAGIGEAKERTVKAGHMLRHIEALEFKISMASGVEAKKADARTSDRYVSAIVEDAEAAGEYERMKALREAAALKIETWRTQSSNFRSMKL